MLHVSTVDGAMDEVESTLITIDEGTAMCWRIGEAAPVARFGLDQVLSIHVDDPMARARKEHPNAYRRWTDEEESTVVAAFERGDTVKEIAAATGRRVGGIRSRLISLGLIEAVPGDRVSVAAPSQT
jgi:hypothetical protein